MGPPFRILSTCKGGGYRYCRTDPPHPRQNSNGLYPLHRVLMENKLGRLLRDGEIVHHDDENKANDDPANLIVKTNSAHSREHALERSPGPMSLTCPVCFEPFELMPRVYRVRVKNNISGLASCSSRCGAVMGRWARSAR